MKQILFLLLFLIPHIKRGHTTPHSFIVREHNDTESQWKTTAPVSATNHGGVESLPHLYRKKRVKKTKTSFKTKSNATAYDSDYNENFVKLIENFLLKHLKKIIKNQSSLGYEVANYHDEKPDNEAFAYKFFQDLKKKYTVAHSTTTTTKTTTPKATTMAKTASTPTTTDVVEEFTLHNKFKKCNFNYTSSEGSEPIVICESTLPTIRTTVAKRPTVTLKRGTEKSKEKSLTELKQTAIYYKNNFSYFVSTIIILSTIAIVLLIIAFTCCAIVCKQRSSLNAYKDNEFFTYYNKNLPIIASVSSFSLNATAKDKLDRIVDRTVGNGRSIYDRHLTGSKELLLNHPQSFG